MLLPRPPPLEVALTQPRPSGEAVPANRRSHRPTRRASLRCANARHLPVSFVHADLTPSPPSADTLNTRSCDCAEPPNARATMRSLSAIVLPSLLRASGASCGRYLSRETFKRGANFVVARINELRLPRLSRRRSEIRKVCSA